MTGKERRLREVNKKQAIGILAIIALITVYFLVFSNSVSALTGHFIKADGSKTPSISIELATNNAQRRKGLMMRKSLDQNNGMLFIFPVQEERAFWMKDTYLSLDMIFIDSNKKIVGILENVPPLNTTPRSVNKPSMYVLELPAGNSKTLDLAPGDQLMLSTEWPVVRE